MDSNEEEYNVETVRERIASSRASRLDLVQKELSMQSGRRRFSRENIINGIKGLIIHPDSRYARFSGNGNLNSKTNLNNPPRICIILTHVAQEVVEEFGKKITERSKLFVKEDRISHLKS